MRGQQQRHASVRRRLLITTALLGLAGTIAVGLYIGDRLLTRGDRILRDAEFRRLQMLQEAIYRFAHEEGTVPSSLAELIPAYASVELTSCRPDPRAAVEMPICWEPEDMRLFWPQPFILRGLFKRRIFIGTTLELHDMPSGTRSNDPTMQDETPPEPGPVQISSTNAGIEQFLCRPITGAVARVVAAAPDEIVVEAELFQALTYGWQIGTDAAAGGGAYLHVKEGVGDFESEDRIQRNPMARTGDFYGATNDRRRIEAQVHFDLPEAGQYHLYARTMAHRMFCSNMTHVRVNDNPRYCTGHNESRPFVWLWHPAGGPWNLSSGRNTVSFQTHQDDVKIDQLLFSPRELNLAGLDSPVFGGGMESGVTATTSNASSVCLSLSADSLNIVGEKYPAVHAYLRRLRAADMTVDLSVSLVFDGETLIHRASKVTIGEHLNLVQVDIPAFRENTQKKGDFALRVAVVEGAKITAERTVVLSRAYDWHILGPLPFIAVSEPGPVDAAAPLSAEYQFMGRNYSWQRYDAVHNDQFGLMDFGLMFATNSYLAPPNSTLYAYTEVDVPESGQYLLKAMGDDDMILWINGESVVCIAEPGPPIRTAVETPVHLNKGRNTVLYRLNQMKQQWQGKVFFRTVDHALTGITGIPFSDQAMPASLTE